MLRFGAPAIANVLQLYEPLELLYCENASHQENLQTFNPMSSNIGPEEMNLRLSAERHGESNEVVVPQSTGESTPAVRSVFGLAHPDRYGELAGPVRAWLDTDVVLTGPTSVHVARHLGELPPPERAEVNAYRDGLQSFWRDGALRTIAFKVDVMEQLRSHYVCDVFRNRVCEQPTLNYVSKLAYEQAAQYATADLLLYNYEQYEKAAMVEEFALMDEEGLQEYMCDAIVADLRSGGSYAGSRRNSLFEEEAVPFIAHAELMEELLCWHHSQRMRPTRFRILNPETALVLRTPSVRERLAIVRDRVRGWFSGLWTKSTALVPALPTETVTREEFNCAFYQQDRLVQQYDNRVDMFATPKIYSNRADYMACFRLNLSIYPRTFAMWRRGEIPFHDLVLFSIANSIILFRNLQPLILLIAVLLMAYSPLLYFWVCWVLIGFATHKILNDQVSYMVVGMLIFFETASLLFGFPVGLFLVIGFLPAVSEERMKRVLGHHFGALGVFAFALGEMALYIEIFGWSVVPVRSLLVVLHMAWSAMPEKWGERAHMMHNSMCVAFVLYTFEGGMFLFAGNILFPFANQEYLQLMSEMQGSMAMIAIASISIAFAAVSLLFLRCVEMDQKEPLQLEAQAHKRSVAHYIVAGNLLFYKDGLERMKCSKFPPLFTFAEWEMARYQGLRDLMSRSAGWASDDVRKHYLLCIRYMQTRKCCYLDEALNLQLSCVPLEPQAGTMTVHDLVNVTGPGITEMLKNHGKAGTMFIRVLTFAHQECSWPVWVAGFSREILEQGIEQQDLMTEELLHGESSKQFARWLKNKMGTEAEPQAGPEFFESPIYKTFMKVIQSVVLGTFLEEKLGMSSFAVKVFPTIGEFLVNLYSLLHMARDAVVCFLTGKKSSVFCSSFAQTESEVDALLKASLPSAAEKDFLKLRAERLATLEGMSEALKTLSAGKPELTMRHIAVRNTIEELRRRMFSNQLGHEPVVLFILGPAGVGKSFILHELNALVLSGCGLLPDGAIPADCTYIYRFLGAKHFDALPEPGTVMTVVLDDFQQCTSDPAAAIIELGFFHANATSEIVPIPMASLEGKSKAAQLQNRFLFMASNHEDEVFKGVTMFNPESVYRRVTVGVIAHPVIPGKVYTAEHPPGRMDVMFRFYTFTHVPGQIVPKKTPRMVEGIFETCDRLVFLRLCTRLCLKQRAFKDAMLKRRLDKDICTSSGLNIGSHYGAQCGGDCKFKDLPEMEPIVYDQLVVMTIDGTVETPRAARISDLAAMEGEWNEHHRRYELIWTIRGIGTPVRIYQDTVAHLPLNLFERFRRDLVPQSASPAANQYAALAATAIAVLYAPDFLRYVVLTVAMVVYCVLLLRNTSTMIKAKTLFYVVGREVIPELWHEAVSLSRVEIMDRRKQIFESGEKFAPKASRAMQFVRGCLHVRIRERVLTKTTVTLALVGAACTAFAGYYAYTQTKEEGAKVMQASNFPSGDNKVLPKMDPTMRKAVVKTYYTGKKPSGRFEDVLPLAIGATARVSVGRMGEPDFRQFAVLTGNLAIVTRHGYVECMNFWPLVNSGDVDKGQRVRFTHSSVSNSAYFPPGYDVAVIEIGEGQKRDITSHFLPMEALRVVVGEAFMLVNGIMHTITITRRVTNYPFNGETITEGFEYNLPFDTFVGLCGAFVIGKSGNGCFFPIGIHHAGLPQDRRVGLGQYISAEFLANMTVPAAPSSETVAQPLEAQSWWPFSSALPIPTDLPCTEGGWAVGDPFILNEMKDRGTTSYLPISAIGVGTLPGRNNRPTNSLRESVLSEHFPEGGSQFYQPAKLQDEEVEPGVWRGPYATLGLATAKDIRVCSVALTKALEDLRMSDAKVVDLMPGMTPLSTEQTVRGVPGLMNGMRLDTSAGFGRSGKLKSVFIKKPEEGPVEVDPKLWAEIVKLVEKPAPYELPVVSCFKVEVRALSKIWLTRAFTIFPVAFLFVCRMFLSAIFALWRQFPFDSETMIGQNAAGKAWTALGEMLDRDEGYVYWYLNIDFKKYDKSFCALLKSCVYDHMMWFVGFTDYTPGQRRVCECLFGMLLNVFIFIHLDCFHIWDWNHSGDPFTVEVNSLGQRILFRYWFFKCVQEAKPGDFQKWVKLMTYGDDGLAKCRRDARLTVLTFVNSMADWGMEATSAAKGDMAECSRADLSFLKRGIVYDEEFDGYRAPLEEASIYKMLCWFDTKSTITEGVWASAVSDNACAEWFLHGREKFAVEVPRLRDACRRAGVVFAGKTWEEYMARYVDTTFATWDL